MKTSNFEGVKVALKQDKTGYVLTLSIHPDDVPDEILRDFVGSRYQVVMVRLNSQEQPMNRDRDLPKDVVQLAGILCNDSKFHEWLLLHECIPEATTQAATIWLRAELKVISRAELKDNKEAAQHLLTINEEFKSWKRNG